MCSTTLDRLTNERKRESNRRRIHFALTWLFTTRCIVPPTLKPLSCASENVSWMQPCCVNEQKREDRRECFCLDLSVSVCVHACGPFSICTHATRESTNAEHTHLPTDTHTEESSIHARCTPTHTCPLMAASPWICKHSALPTPSLRLARVLPVEFERECACVCLCVCLCVLCVRLARVLPACMFQTRAVVGISC